MSEDHTPGFIHHWRPLALTLGIALTQVACNSSDSEVAPQSTEGDVTTSASDAGLFIFNHSPEVTSLLLAVDESNEHLVSLAAHDEDGDDLSWKIVTQPENGTLTGTAPHLSYSPNTGFSGSDSFQVQVSDGSLESEITTITLVVRKLNDKPVANSQSLSMEKNTVLEINLSGSDLDEDPLTFILESLPEHGKLTGSVPHFTYEPDEGYEGDDTFTFTVGDGTEFSTESTVEIAVSYPSRPLNDTGIVFGGNYTTDNNDSCIGETIEAQDCSSGRDATISDASDGRAGFSFTKLGETGEQLLPAAIEWACVKDNVTGLIWEIKTEHDDLVGEQSLNDSDDTYNWFNENPSENNGAVGYDDADGATCFGYDENIPTTYCNTQAYTARVNETAICGYSDWRMPDRGELESILDLNNPELAIDIDYFPATKAAMYWTSVPSQGSRAFAFVTDFQSGQSLYKSRRDSYHIRLVRSEWD